MQREAGVDSGRPVVHAPRGHVQPAHGNVPRRAKPLNAAQVRVRRRRERCFQELGRESGIFIAFACSPADGSEDEGFNAVVRISPIQDGKAEEGTSADVDDKGGGGGAAVARFSAHGTRDDGVPCLQPAQLRAACTFVCQHRAEGRRVLIVAPRAHAVDALSVGVCCISRRAHPTEAVEDGSEDAEQERVHRLVMRWHDLPAEDDDEDDAYGAGGLKDEWRGLLSRDGMDYLAAAVGHPALASPRSPPLPSPSP